MKKRIAGYILALCLGLTACSTGEVLREEGLFYEAGGISPDAVLMTIDDREIPAWRYLYWLVYTCDYIRTSYEKEGQELDWEAPLADGTLADYAAEQALRNTALYATVENWAVQYEVELTEEDRTAMEADWAEKTSYYGSEEAYLQALQDMGLTRTEAETMSGDYYLYSHLYDLSCQEGSGLYPAEEDVAAFAEDQGYVTVDYLLVSTAQVADGDTEALNARRERAEEAFSKLNGSDDGAAAFEGLADTYSDAEQRRMTFLPGDGTVPQAVEDAAAALEEGQWSGIVESDQGFYILLRQPPDSAQVREGYFDQTLQQAADEAEVVYTDDYDALDVASFYTAILQAREGA